jgi:chromosomal replication initiation ATPase DnaA
VYTSRLLVVQNICGPHGKTHVALAIGLAACQKGYRVRFTTAALLVHELMEARDEKRLLRFQKHLASFELLIVDELGFVPLSKTGAEMLFEIFSQRYERSATMVTSNLPFNEWTEILGSERLTGALLDRLTHHVHILEMYGESYRLKESKQTKTGKARAQPAGPPNSARPFRPGLSARPYGRRRPAHQSIHKLSQTFGKQAQMV